jgi:transcriptional regulator with XRE-family HTH domain
MVMADDPLKAVPDRLREAREYLGFTREDTAAALRCSPLLIEALEAGTADSRAEMLERLAAFYRRPVSWLCGVSDFQPSPEMLRKVEGLSAGDREAILDFAEWLQGAGPAPETSRRRGKATGGQEARGG